MLKVPISHTTYLSAKQTCKSWCCVSVHLPVREHVEMTEWQDRMTWCQDDQLTEWPSDQVTEWPSDQVTKWSSDQMTKWVDDWMTGSFADNWPHGIFIIYDMSRYIYDFLKLFVCLMLCTSDSSYNIFVWHDISLLCMLSLECYW